MFDSILGKGDWADLTDVLTPTLCDVLPARATLYEHLERLGLEFDVRAAYTEAGAER